MEKIDTTINSMKSKEQSEFTEGSALTNFKGIFGTFKKKNTSVEEWLKGLDCCQICTPK